MQVNPAMEINFCDLCNESVPEADLTAGKAVRRGDRVICAICESAMSASHEALAGAAAGASGNAPLAPSAQVAVVTAPAGARAERRSGGGWLGLVALVFSAGGIAYLAREIDTEREADAGAHSTRAAEVRSLERANRELLASLDRRTEAHARELRDGLASVQRDLTAELTSVRADLATNLARLSTSEAELAAIRLTLESETSSQGARLDELTALLLRAREDASFHGERLAAVEQAILSGAGLSAAPAPAGATPVTDGAPSWQGLVADLASENAAIRWNAVDGLGETRDMAVVPHILPVLKDEDVFVRMAVARVLGDLASPLGIEPLIDALEDEEAVVRETAMLSLRSITGRDFKFDAVASPAERTKKVKAWRKWWETAEAEYFPAGQP